MDFSSIHLAPLPRRFPGLLQVGTVGYIPHKQNWIRHPFSTFNFSFILKGAGLYRTAQREWEVRAPCVITQWPGVHVEYGPHLEWEELYLIYDAAHMAALRRSQLVKDGKPVWYLQDPGPVRRRLDELNEALTAGEEGGISPDRVDRICESLVMESLISETTPVSGPHERAILAARAQVEAGFLGEIDFDKLALEHGFSPSSFRRHWNEHVGTPPQRFLVGLRIRRACRLLVETSMSVGQIAQAVRFDDPLYFSRRFREITGESASDYRRSRRYPSAGADAAPQP
ncbi:MAG TPA: AraC family transcriptional regulator [Planctomycetota bacterium]|nr:AraC family transcriptional regulator [Planctomycetota bacterium]